VRAPVLLAVSVIASITALTVPADAQVRAARPRTVIASRPLAVSRPTVFVGGYYYPTFYRASLWYDPWPGYYGYYGYGPYYQVQIPIYGRGRGYGYDRSGSVRLQVSPRQSEVFVDGYFAGTVDDFDGVFQRLNIESGEHEVQVYLAGYRTFTQRFYLQPGKSFNIKHTMEPLRPGEQASPRPDPAPGAGLGPGDDGGRGIARGAGRGARGEGAGRGEGRGARSEGRGGRAGGPSEGFGSLSLRVQPADADVLIDGEPWRGSQESGPLIVQLGAGTHHIEIRKDGYRSYLTDIPLGNGQTRTLNVALTKQ
jgi:PEGA domain-containing protein